MGVKEVELDVRFTRDRHIVLCHDEELARYGYPNLKVSELTAAEFLTLDMGSWFSPFFFKEERVLFLDTLFQVFRDRFIYHIEVKQENVELLQRVLDLAVKYNLKQKIIITCKYYPVLLFLQKLDPDTKAGWIVDVLTKDDIARAKEAGFYQICPPAESIQPHLVEFAHAQGLEVRVHHIRDLEDVVRAVKFRCDGATVDWPDHVIQVDRGKR